MKLKYLDSITRASFVVFVLFLFARLSCDANVEPDSNQPVLIAWGGVSPYGISGFGYGRLLRLGANTVRRGYRSGGKFSHNHNRVNNATNAYSGNGYGQASSSVSGNGPMVGRAQSRFNQQHSNNELWNSRSQMGQSNKGDDSLWNEFESSKGNMSPLNATNRFGGQPNYQGRMSGYQGGSSPIRMPPPVFNPQAGNQFDSGQRAESGF